MTILAPAACRTLVRIPLFLATVRAGFPSPAEGWIEKPLNLHELAVANPAATFFVRAAGESMRNAGIYDGDILVVDRSLLSRAGDVVVAEIDGEFTVKFLALAGGRPQLEAANPDFPTLRPRDGQTLTVVGVVRGVYRQLK